jgi:hypothetical protein
MRKPRSMNNDLTGQRFTRWLVIDRAYTPSTKGSMWNCECDCGTLRVVSLSNLRGNLSKSCGCLHRERLGNRRRTHGMSQGKSPEYAVWQNIKTRCTNKKRREYKNYGGRGIVMSPRWITSFENFLADVGKRPSPKHTIDRIDNDRGYEPGNVRWATRTEQNQNKRNSRLVTHDGVTKTVAAWARDLGFTSDFLYYRLFNRGMSFENAISTPKQMGKRLT